MSRIAEIDILQEAKDQAERMLSDGIHKVLFPDRVIWYQEGFSEHASSWQEYVVLYPHSKFVVAIRPRFGETTVHVDGTSHRLLLEKPGNNPQNNFSEETL